MDAAINTHSANAHSAPAENETLPYLPDEALTGSSGSGSGSSTNIVVDEEAYFNLSYQVSSAMEEYGQIAYAAFAKVERMTADDFNLPANTPQVLGIAERLKAALYEKRDIHDEFAQNLRDYVREMLGDDESGHIISLAWDRISGNRKAVLLQRYENDARRIGKFYIWIYRSRFRNSTNNITSGFCICSTKFRTA